MTLDLARCRNFGECDYKLLRQDAESDGHSVVEHDSLIEELRRVAIYGEKDERLKAIQALRYAKSRREGLVDWRFDLSRVERKDVIDWCGRQIQKYFARC